MIQLSHTNSLTGGDVMQQPITQQLQRTQQLCTNAMNLCQQVVQELNQIHQAVQASTYAQPSYNSGQSQGYSQGNYGYASNISTVMNADRGYGTSAQGSGQYASFQGGGAGVQAVMAADHTGQANTSYGGAGTSGSASYQSSQGQGAPSYGSTGGSSGSLSAVMQADRGYSSQATQGNRSSGSGYGATTMTQNSGFSSSGVANVMQADRYSPSY